MKRAAVLLLLAGAASMPQRAELFDQRLESFNEPYARFYRSFHGCTPEASSSADCRRHLAVLDRREFGRARTAAMKLFELGEPK